MLKKLSAIILTALLAASLTACGTSAPASSSSTASSDSTAIVTAAYTEGDLTQATDTSGSTDLTLSDGKTLTITAAGVYTVSGNAKNASVIVEAGKEDKVQIILNGVNITNDSTPAVYVKSADEVVVTTAAGTTNTLAVTGTFTDDGDTKTDAVIFAKDDLTLGGEGTLTLTSSKNGISGKDDVKVTGGTITIDCAADAIEANNDIEVSDGALTIKSQKDGLHAENDKDNTQGSITIGGGTLNITASSDAIQATTTAVINGGTLSLTASEGIEATNVTINDGNITIEASDDGINASNKSSSQKVAVTINGGNIKITMGQGDTDGIDSNGDLTITGGTIDITGQSACDYDGTAQKTGGTLIVNGTETDTIPNQMMGGGMGDRGDMGGQMPNGQMPNGQMPGGQMPNGQMPNDQTTNGQTPNA